MDVDNYNLILNTYKWAPTPTSKTFKPTSIPLIPKELSTQLPTDTPPPTSDKCMEVMTQSSLLDSWKCQPTSETLELKDFSDQLPTDTPPLTSDTCKEVMTQSSPLDSEH